jgi:hypothetical protein
MPRTTNRTPEEIVERTRQKKKEYYERNKEKMKECNRRNYNNKISDEVKIEKIKKIMATIKNKELINTLLK